MSNSLSIAAVTATLRKLIEDQIKADPAPTDTEVTTQPPDKVPEKPGNLINIFLYQTALNAAWRNADMPGVKRGETGLPPLALDLYYLVTAYSKNDDKPEPDSHQLLGRAMSILHDHPLLSAADIKAALPAPGSSIDVNDFDIYDQIERVRITPRPMTLDEISKLWTMFQVKYRISAAYQVSVVLIESKRPAKTPLPVTQRGEGDTGVSAQGNLTSPFPTLTGLAFPNALQPSIEPGEVLKLSGHHLDGDRLSVHFDNPRLAAPIVVPQPAMPAPTSDGPADISVTVPDDPPNWVAGFYNATVVVERDADTVNPTRTTNALSFSLAPKILNFSPPSSPAPAKDFNVIVVCDPEVRAGQHASLLFGDREIPADEHLTQTDTLTFRVTNVGPESVGKYFLRLRVDGVDSLLLDYTKTPPEFDQGMVVEITET
ncbi:MAG TPA: DUF4255 domain-containing protein [Pyrinomonadaceae bacterium]|nr:DUF4255 domain-containing protein [Pyrinomonadaceae bacterium]